MGIRLIVGLGNPGKEYAATRHNAGFWLLERLADLHAVQFRTEAKFFGEVARINLANMECWLLKPMGYMNRSGQAVAALANYYKIEPSEVLVAHDELDLAPGVLRLKYDGGHAGHNGLRDIIAQLGTREFHRLRIGIGHPGTADAVTPYVLGRPGTTEREQMEQALRKLDDELELLFEGDFAGLMNSLHQHQN